MTKHRTHKNKTNMKRYFLMVLILSSINGFSQTLTDLFLLVPEINVMRLKSQDRVDMINAFKENLKDSSFGDNYCKLSDFDSKNGYLRIIGGFEGEFELCFWNLENNDRLIAISKTGCGPVCHGKLQFFLYHEGTIIEKPIWGYIPDRSGFDQINFIKDDVKVSEIRKLFSESYFLTYKLPRNGKNILCVYEWSEYFDEDYIREILKGDNLELVWDNGKFKFGNIFFK